MKRFLRVLLGLLFWGNLVLLLVSLCAAYIDPYYFWPPALIGLLLWPLLGIHLFLTVIFLIRKKMLLATIGFLLLLASLPSLQKQVAIGSTSAGGNGRQLKVMSYNVRYFSYFYAPDTTKAIFQTIDSAEADVICFQDYFMSPHLRFRRVVDSFRLAKGYKYRYEHVPNQPIRPYHTGMAIYSKYPFYNVKPLSIHKSGSNGAFSVDVVMGKDTIRFFNVHLQSVGLSEQEYTLSGLEETFETKDTTPYFKNSLKKLRHAFRKRSVQVSELKKALAASPYPVVLCGDFNDTPNSFAYAQMRKYLDDTFLEAGKGIGITFAGKLPLLRIDYIMAGPAFEVEQAEVLSRIGSDHYPVMASLRMGE